MSSFTPGVTAHPAYDPVGILVNGPAPRRIEVVTLLSGQGPFPAGRFLGKITVGGKYKESLAASADGSQLYTQGAFLMDAVPSAVGVDTPVRVLLAGDFHGSKVSFGTGQSLAAGKDYLIKSGLHPHSDYAITE